MLPVPPYESEKSPGSLSFQTIYTLTAPVVIEGLSLMHKIEINGGRQHWEEERM